METIKKSLGLIVMLALVFLISYNSSKYNLANIKGIEIASQNIRVDLALTPSAQTEGLSGRASLLKNEGMLFIFSRPGRYSFWMKEMNFPIDIVWIAEDLKVIYIKKDAQPESYPDVYKPDQNEKTARYVLEVLAGFSEKNNLQIGDRVKFTY